MVLVPATQNVQAALNISPVPLFLGGVIEPNIMFTLDDSGSMQWEAMPDSELLSSAGYPFYYLYPNSKSLYGGGYYQSYYDAVLIPAFEADNQYSARMRSNHNNKIYYNPEVTYIPWSTASGGSFGDVNPAMAYHNPANTSLGYRDFTVLNDASSDPEQSYAWWRYSNTHPTYSWSLGTRGFWPGTYYNWTPGVHTDCDAGTSEESVNNPFCYTMVEIKPAVTTYTGGADRTDCAAAPVCAYAEEVQNFANWYTYYRSRVLLARAGAGRAFSAQSAGMRVGFGALNEGSHTIDGQYSANTLIRGVRPFEDSGTDTYRSDFFDLLYEHVIPTMGTPLRRSLNDIGKYFKRSDNGSPWRDDPTSSSATTELTCRQSYNILMTDGYWNGSNPAISYPSAAGYTPPGDNNVDGNNGPTIIGPEGQSSNYVPENPYKDDHDWTLADISMAYWYQDLRSDLDNEVPTNPADDAFWQHLVNFTVGLGVEGTVTQTQLDNLAASDPSPWPQPYIGGGTENIDDLFHAGVNSRGGFFSARDPDEFAEAMTNTLSQIAGRTSSAASIATNSTRLDSDTYVYQARFDSTDWHGQLRAFKVNQFNGEILTSDPDNWEAGYELDNRPGGQVSREIYTHDSNATNPSLPGVEFNWAVLPAAHRAHLAKSGDTGTEAEDRLNYLRGDSSNEEKNGGAFRDRGSILGDIVNSDPFFIGNQDYAYNNLPAPEGGSYTTFRDNNIANDRPGVVYVGANDGMLHAINAETGEELFAYVPEAIFPDLIDLTEPTYSHSYYVDGQPKGGDAYINGWKTVLLGTLGAGGKGVFALDVTDPDNFSASNVMWEFTTADDADLGFTIGQGSVVRMADGSWAAVFGNGYNSTSGKAVLYIVDLEDGSVIAKIDTEADGDNGLSAPTTVDYNGDRIIDYIYAGDLKGNMWAFDVTDSKASGWDILYGSKNSPAPLFTAFYDKDNDNNFDVGDDYIQPITSKPEVSKHPSGGMMVFFGTGKYFEATDTSSLDKMSYYGIWDDVDAQQAAPVDGGRPDLVEQTIDYELVQTYTNPDSGDTFTWDLRVTSENDVNTDPSMGEVKMGWYMDLRQPDPADPNNHTTNLTWQGERVVSAPLLRENRLVFTTLIPSGDPCEFGGTGWLMEISALDGKRLSISPFDLNNDGLFNTLDYVFIGYDYQGQPIYVPASGKKSKEGIIKTPGIVKTEDKEYKYVSGSSGGIEMTVESRSARTGRQSWRQLQ